MIPGQGNLSVRRRRVHSEMASLALSDNLETVPKAIATIIFIIRVTDRLQIIARHLH